MGKGVHDASVPELDVIASTSMKETRGQVDGKGGGFS